MANDELTPEELENLAQSPDIAWEDMVEDIGEALAKFVSKRYSDVEENNRQNDVQFIIRDLITPQRAMLEGIEDWPTVMRMVQWWADIKFQSRIQSNSDAWTILTQTWESLEGNFRSGEHLWDEPRPE